MLDNLSLMVRGQRMAKILRNIAAITQKKKRLRNEAIELKREYEKLRGEVKRLRRGEKL